MQLLQRLTEQADRQQEVAELISLIKQAKVFFDQRGNNESAWLYRGVKRSDVPEGLVGVASPRSDRRPTDTATALHDRLDNRLYQDFGIKYRSTSFFVSGDEGLADDYGRVCLILPLGEFKYVYSKNTRDAYNKFRARKVRAYILKQPEAQHLDLSGMPTGEGQGGEATTRHNENEAMAWLDNRPETRALVDRWFEEAYQLCKYTAPSNIIEGIWSSNELMLHCAQVAVIPVQPTVHPDTIQAAERQLNAKFDLGMEAYPGTKELIDLMLPYIFK